jgi:ABC-2 type transport system ATP-binding protein
MLIDANHLSLNLEGQRILSDINLHLWRGEIYGLLGPNGAGKSTTIALLLGLYAADSGKLRLFDSPQADPVNLRRRIGVMPEHAGFYDWMSANDYLVWHAGFYGGLQQSVAELLELVGLGDTGRKPISQFSRGMTQRLALARALVHGPELLILDEPTNGLDPRGRREVHDLLLQLAKERQVGILLCTHLLDDVERLCSTIGIIDQGRTITEGTLADLLGSGDAVLRYRLRMSQIPDDKNLPKGVKLLHQEGDWWHVEVAAAALPQLPALWQGLIAAGWGLTEIHAEGGGLEELYLRLTTTASNVTNKEGIDKEHAA